MDELHHLWQNYNSIEGNPQPVRDEYESFEMCHSYFVQEFVCMRCNVL